VTNAPKSNWLFLLRGNRPPSMRLFCFPFAGGGIATFTGWRSVMPATVELALVRLPGRESRIAEPPVTSIEDLVEKLIPELRPHLDLPFAVFGHSLGALIAFETLRELARLNLGGPFRLFVSGAGAPHRPNPNPLVAHLDDMNLIRAVSERYQGISADVLDHPALLQLMLPALRADFTMLESYVYREGPPFVFPISCYGGVDDPIVSLEALDAWRECTRGLFQQKIFPGNHFFLQGPGNPVAREVASVLLQSGV
jgi:medium-chain acyl-[acyl-carrier-protein] hydrolase